MKPPWNVALEVLARTRVVCSQKTHMRYLVARNDARPFKKNCIAEIRLKIQSWIGIHISGPILQQV